MNRRPPLGVAFIGCGSVMRGAYLPLALDHARRADITIIGAADRTDRHRAELQSVGVDRFAVDVDEVLGWPDVDLVVVATPMDSHASIASAALRAGKHVLLEKPMAGTLAEADELVTTANEAPGHLVVAPAVVLSDTYARMSEHIRNGEMGQISMARALYAWAGPDWSSWFYEPGGGSLRDLGVYNLTTLTGLLGPAVAVVAMAGITEDQRTVRGEVIDVAVEDHMQLLLEFASGAHAVVTSGFTVQNSDVASVEIYGTQATMYLHGHDWSPDGYALWTNEAASWRRFPERDPHWPWTAGLSHLIDCVRSGRRPVMTVEHARHVVEIVAEAHTSLIEGRRQSVASSFPAPEVRVEDDGGQLHRMHDRGRRH